MSATTWEKIGEGSGGDGGRPGTGYCLVDVTVRRHRRSARYQIRIVEKMGQNQGPRLEERDRREWEFRADSLADLLAVAIAEVRRDADSADTHDLEQAIRAAIFEAEDAEDAEAAGAAEE